MTSKLVWDCSQSLTQLADITEFNRYGCQVMRELWVMKRQLSWQEQDLNIRSQDLNHLAASQLELSRKRPGSERAESQRTLGIHNWTQTDKGIYTGSLCQKNEGSVEVKQKPVKMGGRIISRTLLPKRAIFKLGLTDNCICERCQAKDKSATYDLVTWVNFFMERNYYYDTPIHEVQHFIRSVGLIKR
jgi:hypothetical protein